MRAKIIILMIIIILFTIFVTQNTLVIPVEIFFWRIEMSVIVLISLCTLIGIIIGFILLKIFDRPKEDKSELSAESEKDNGIRQIR